jgi:hypothetical protein
MREFTYGTITVRERMGDWHSSCEGTKHWGAVLCILFSVVAAGYWVIERSIKKALSRKRKEEG